MHTMNDICETPDETPAAVAATPSAFDTRWQRIIDCVALKQPDRMPVAFYSTFWLARYAGITCRELMYDYEKTREIGERAVLEFDPDVVSPLLLTATAGPSLEAIGFKQLQWPGHGVGDDQPFQYLDREYMKADEYEDFIFDPTGYYLHTYLPRVASAFEGFEDLPYLPGLYYFRLLGGIRPFAKPRVREALEKVIRAAEEAERFAQHHIAFTDRLAPLGYLVSFGQSSGFPAPLDIQRLGGLRSLFVTRPSLFAYTQARPDYLRHANVVLDMIGSGALKVRIGATYPLAEAAAAHIALAGRQTAGKVVLVP